MCALLHILWTKAVHKAVHKEGYDKKEWQKLAQTLSKKD